MISKDIITLGFFVTLTIIMLVMPRRSCAEADFVDIDGLAAIIVTQQKRLSRYSKYLDLVV